MASYDARINVLLSGGSNLDRVLTRLNQFESQIQRINATPIDISRTIGRGENADRLGIVQRRIQQLRDDYLELGEAQRRWANGNRTGSGVGGNATINQLKAQSELLESIARNSKLASAQFKEMTIASQMASVKTNEAGRERLAVLAEAFSASGSRSRMGNVRGDASLRVVQELIAAGPGITRSEAALSGYINELEDLKKLVPFLSNEYRGLEDAIARVNRELSSAGLHGQSSAIQAAMGPATNLGSVSAFTQRESYQKKVNDELSRQVAIEDRINQGLLDQVHKTHLLNRLYQAADALSENRLDDAIRLTREIDRQRFSLERLNRSQRVTQGGSSSGGTYMTGVFSPIDGQKRLNAIYGANEMLASKLLALEAKGLNISSEKLTLQNQINRIQSGTFDINLKNLDLENETLAAITRSISLLQQRSNILKSQSTGYPSSPIGGGVNMPGSPIFNQTPFLERRFGRKGSAAISEGLIGGAFPLLFGQGLGASAGGGLGGALGGFAGGGLGFGLSLIGTALGSAIDGLAAAAKDAAASLRDPITNFQKLADAGLFASKSQEQQIRNLIEYGNSTKAAAVIQEELAKKIGLLAMRDMANLDEQSVRLGKAWAELNLQIQAAIAGPLAGLLEWTANMVELFSGGNRREVQRKDFVESLTPAGKIEYNRRRALNMYGATGESEAALRNSLKGQTVPIAPPALKIDPQKQQEEFDKNRQENRDKDDKLLQRQRENEDLIRNSKNQTRQFEYQLIDLQRQAVDLQRRVNDDIFNKQQAIQRGQIANDQLRKQISIESVDAQYRRMISNEEGRSAAVLSAEADLVKIRSTNAAEIEAARRNLELDIAKQQRDTENYIYGLAREADSIRRATLNYEVQIEDYKLSTERKIADLRLSTIRQEEDARTKAERGSPVWQGAGAGMAPTGKIVSIGGGHNLDSAAAGAYKQMVADAAAQGVRISLTSSYRSNAEQAVLYNRYLNGTGNLAAPPGRSGHNRGTSLDVRTGIEWMQRNGAKYGWHNTGMSFSQKEPWHFDYKSGTMQRGNQSATGVASVDAATARVQGQTAAIPAGPKIPGVPVSAIRGQRVSLDNKDKKIKEEQIVLQQKLNGLEEYAAMERLAIAARGENTVKSKQRELALVVAEAKSIGAMSADKQEIATFDARTIESLNQIKIENDNILNNTKLTGKEKKMLADANEAYLTNAVNTLAVERNILTVQQQQQFNAEKAAAQLQLKTRGTGVAAGFFGAGAQAYEQKILKSGNVQQATDLAKAARMGEVNDEIVAMRENLAMLQDPSYRVVESAKAIGSAFSESFKGTVSGSMTAQQALANLFQRTADHFLDMATQMLAQQAILKLIGFGLNLFAPAAGAIGGGGLSGAFGTTPSTGFSDAATMNLGFAKGGVFSNSIVSSPTLFKFANGGALSSGVMGEAGPEAVMPLTRGPGGRLGVDASGSGGGAVNVTVNVDAKGTEAQGDSSKSSELGRVIGDAVRQEIMKQKRHGGLLAK